MLRALVLLLMLPPMLMPPGMCICQFVPTGTASAPPSASPVRELSASHDTNPRADCTCASCRSQAGAALPADSDNQPSPGDDGPSRHEPGKHWPGCPAAADATPFNMVVPTVTVQADLVAAAGFFTPVVVAVVSPVRATPIPAPAYSPPLFISHCTLLI